MEASRNGMVGFSVLAEQGAPSSAELSCIQEASVLVSLDWSHISVLFRLKSNKSYWLCLNFKAGAPRMYLEVLARWLSRCDSTAALSAEAPR